MTIAFRRPTRADMNRGIMPEGVPPTLSQIKSGARYPGKPYTVAEDMLIRRYRTDLATARKLEADRIRKENVSRLL